MGNLTEISKDSLGNGGNTVPFFMLKSGEDLKPQAWQDFSSQGYACIYNIFHGSGRECTYSL